MSLDYLWVESHYWWPWYSRYGSLHLDCRLKTHLAVPPVVTPGQHYDDPLLNPVKDRFMPAWQTSQLWPSSPLTDIFDPSPTHMTTSPPNLSGQPGAGWRSDHFPFCIATWSSHLSFYSAGHAGAGWKDYVIITLQGATVLFLLPPSHPLITWVPNFQCKKTQKSWQRGSAAEPRPAHQPPEFSVPNCRHAHNSLSLCPQLPLSTFSSFPLLTSAFCMLDFFLPGKNGHLFLPKYWF